MAQILRDKASAKPTRPAEALDDGEWESGLDGAGERWGISYSPETSCSGWGYNLSHNCPLPNFPQEEMKFPLIPGGAAPRTYMQ